MSVGTTGVPGNFLADLPLVSVVVATNRGGPFLAEALDSVAAQTYPEIETVVVDDGSSEDDAEMISQAVDGRPRTMIVRTTHGGVARARNIGVSHTEGSLLVFLDDDDRWHPRRIELQVAAMSDTRVVASYCGLRTVDEHGSELAPADQHQVRDVHEVLQRTTGILLPNLMTRHDAFVAVGGFHAGFRYAEDLDLVLQIALIGDLRFVDGPLVDYRHHANNTTSRYRELCRSIDRVVRLHAWSATVKGRADLAGDHRISLARNRRYGAWRATTSAREALRRGDLAAAARDVIWLAGFAPTAPVDWAAERLRRRRATVEARRV